MDLIRLEGYSMFRGLSLNVESLAKFSAYLTASLTESFHVLEDSWSRDKTLSDLDLPGRTGAKLIAIVREDELLADMDDDLRVQKGDMLIIFGRHAKLDNSLQILKDGPPLK